MKVVRVYHGGRNSSHRERERMLAASGADVTLVVPRAWPEAGSEVDLSQEPFRVVELPVRRSGDVNRHAYADVTQIAGLLEQVAPDVLDLHEEPFSVAAQQWLRAADAKVPVVMYTAQNVDKRYPPPFDRAERRSLRRVEALYPCTRQAASVARGKGFQGQFEVIPLGFDPTMFSAGEQSLDDDVLEVALVGRLVPEKGVVDAVRVLAHLNELRPTRLTVVGQGPEARTAQQLADQLGVADRLRIEAWRPARETAAIYRRAHVVLVPSTPTTTWTEQFGRVIVEAQASGAVVAGYAAGSIPEVAGQDAVLVGEGDSQALARAVAALVADHRGYEARRAGGLELSRERTWLSVAGRQASLYRDVASGEVRRASLPASPRARRALAVAEFGPPAATVAGERPFALPVLRRGGLVAEGLAAVIDVGAEAVARVHVGSNA